MIEVGKKLDASNATIPKFLCDAHGKMLPSSGVEVISEHFLGLFMEASTVKKELNELDKNNNVTKILICARYETKLKILN